MSLSDRNVLPKMLSSYQFIHLNVNGAKRWFPKVGSSFTWFILRKVENKNPFVVENHYVQKGVQKVQLPKKVGFVPLYCSQISLDIIAKTINRDGKKYKVETTSYLHRHTKQEFLQEHRDEVYKYRIIHTPTKTLWSRVPHRFQNGWKVFLSLSNQYGAFVDNCGMTQSIAFVRCASEKEALRIKEELSNKVFVYLNNLTRYGNFNNIRILQKFPILETIRLTKIEEDHIDVFLNLYYYGKQKRYSSDRRK